MDHREIEDEQWIERYVMQRLDAEETERFEEHYLTCSRCLGQLELAERFQRALRDVATEEIGRRAFAERLGFFAAIARISRWQQAAMASALVLLVLAPSFWALRLDGERRQLDRHLTAALAPAAQPLVVPLSPERSAEEEPSVQLRLEDGETERLLFSVDTSLLPPAATWDVELTSPGPDAPWRARGLAPSPTGGLVLSVPSPYLVDGIHRLQITSGDSSGKPVYTFTFRVVR